jgi:excisionase family DNA binding protein
MERRTPHTMYELLQQDQYRADEVAKLLGIGLAIVRHAAFTGELRAEIVGHHILRLRRDDVLVWLGTREGLRRDDAAEAASKPRSMGEHGDV